MYGKIEPLIHQFRISNLPIIIVIKIYNGLVSIFSNNNNNNTKNNNNNNNNGFHFPISSKIPFKMSLINWDKWENYLNI